MLHPTIPLSPCEDKEEWIARITLSFVFEHQVKNLHKILDHFPDAQAVLRSPQKTIEDLLKKTTSRNLHDPSFLQKAVAEYKHTTEHGIELCYYKENNYPTYLSQCEDKPIFLYKKGEREIPFRRMISIIGTRACSEYGKKVVKKIVEELSIYQPVIVSGLAYGIDSIAHQAALDHKLKTVAVLGNGLQRIYPPKHHNLSRDIIKQGALYTEYDYKKEPDNFHFPMRNRIVAGMSVGTLVVETDIKGGSMITASLACSYNREVMCIPNSIYASTTSAGCHQLIKKNMATLVENGEDVANVLGWEKVEGKPIPKQTSIKTLLLTEKQQLIVRLLEKQENIHIDALSIQANIEQQKIAIDLLELEMQGIIRKLPGNCFCIA